MSSGQLLVCEINRGNGELKIKRTKLQKALQSTPIQEMEYQAHASGIGKT